MLKRGGIYCRMSKSKGAAKIEQQEVMCRKLAEANDIEVVRVYVDDGISAYDEKALRPAWSKMLEDVSAGELDVLLAQSEDRFSRQTAEKLTLQAVCVAGGASWITVNDGMVDPAKSDGTFFSELRGSLAKMESARKIERQQQANDARAAAGKVRTGGPRPVGWRADKVHLEPAESDELRWAVEQVLGGATVFSVVRAWNGRGFRTSTGATWQMVTVKQALVRPRMAGLMMHRGQIMEGVVGEWEPICTPEEFRGLCAILNTKKQPYNTREPKHLLSSIMRCTCGEAMRYCRNGSGRKAYRCFTRMTGVAKGQQHVTVAMDQADEVVSDAVVSALLFAPSEAAEGEAESLARLHAQLDEIGAARSRLVDAVAAGVLSTGEVAAKKAELAHRAEQVEAELARVSSANARAALIWKARGALWRGGRVKIEDAVEAKAIMRREFDALPLEQKRGLIRGLVRVTVNPGRTAERIDVEHIGAPSLSEPLGA